LAFLGSPSLTWFGISVRDAQASIGKRQAERDHCRRSCILDIFANLKVRTKLSLLLGLSVLAPIVSIGAAAPLIRQRMIDDRVGKLRAVVQSSIGIAQSLENRVAAKQLTQDEALAMLRDDIHAVRFDGGEGNVTIQVDGSNGETITLTHGADPSRDGEPSDAVDSDDRSAT
jgi:methyl-accepting chemotaxis protein